jgi:hypothetical protein
MENLIETLERLFAQYSDGKPDHGDIGHIVSGIGHEEQVALVVNGITIAAAIVLAIFSPFEDVRIGLCKKFKKDGNFVRLVASSGYLISQEESDLLNHR